jgi:hypothetical protein
MNEIEKKMQHMDVLAEQIIEISHREVESSKDTLRFRHSVQKKLRQSKNELISELMTLISECRKMRLSQAENARLDTAITGLNKKLYEATSLVIL